MTRQPKTSSPAVAGSGVPVRGIWEEAVDGVQGAPPLRLNSVKTSKKLSTRNCPPPMDAIVVWPVLWSVGDSRIINGPPWRFIDSISVLNVPSWLSLPRPTVNVWTGPLKVTGPWSMELKKNSTGKIELKVSSSLPPGKLGTAPEKEPRLACWRQTAPPPVR